MAEAYSRNSERLFPRYHPEHLAALVGDENTELPDDVVEAMINIMKAHAEPEFVPYIGYYTPAQIEYYCSQIQPHTAPLPANRDILNIHNLDRHWVTTFYSAECRTVFVCDSLKTQSHTQQIEKQVKIIYGHLATKIVHVPVVQQSTQPLCGPLAIAFAVAYYFKTDPSKLCFDLSKVNKHLKTCIQLGTVTQFPTIDSAEPFSTVDTTDSLIFCDDTEDEIFAKAFKDGFKVVNNIRLMIVGMFGVGKTSLTYKLIKDFRDAPEISTQFLNLHRCELRDDGDWCLDIEGKITKSKLRLIEKFNIASHIRADIIKESALVRLLLKALKTNESFSDNIKTRVATNTNTTVTVWDFAGQTLYYSTYQVFLNKRSIYLFLIDMTKSLDEYVKDDGWGTGTACGLMQDCTYLEVFKFWLNSIYINSGYKSAENTISPTVILVGTHKDKMVGNDDDKEIQKDDYFHKALRSVDRSPVLDHIHSKTFLVNNLSREDPVFHEIQREIKLLAEKKEYWVEKYPFKWIQMEQYFDKMRGTGKQLLHIAEINIANSSFIHPLTETELGLFFDIQHRHGNILYFNTDQLRHLVVLYPEFIIEVYKCFISHKRNKNPLYSKHWILYEELAILTPEVLNEIMDQAPKDIRKNREHIMQYMEHLDIMAKPLKFEEDVDATSLKQPKQATVDLAVNVNPIFFRFLHRTMSTKESTTTHFTIYIARLSHENSSFVFCFCPKRHATGVFPQTCCRVYTHLAYQKKHSVLWTCCVRY